jgi:hypothetical protein
VRREERGFAAVRRSRRFPPGQGGLLAASYFFSGLPAEEQEACGPIL